MIAVSLIAFVLIALLECVQSTANKQLGEIKQQIALDQRVNCNRALVKSSLQLKQYSMPAFRQWNITKVTTTELGELELIIETSITQGLRTNETAQGQEPPLLFIAYGICVGLNRWLVDRGPGGQELGHILEHTPNNITHSFEWYRIDFNNDAINLFHL